MPASGVETRLADLLAFTERMLTSAEAADWEGLELLAQERQRRLGECFGPELDAEASERVTEAIAALLSLNGRLVQQVAAARSEVMGNLSGLRQGRGGRDCYGAVQDLAG